jgi:hypothetical protein
MTPPTELLRRFIQLDRALQARGFPATDPWWHETIARWYHSGVLQLVGRVGRGGGKSSTMCRLAVCEALYGGHRINPGDTGVVTIVSAGKRDANERLTTIREILEALGWTPGRRGQPLGPREFIETAEEIQLPARRIAFRVFAASVRAVSGFTSIFILLDEVAKWRDERTGISPATEVYASVKATRRARRKKIALISSPLGLVDLHADLFALGDTQDQIAVHAPTWIANTSVTEAECRAQEANALIFDREYRAIPQAEDELSVYTSPQVERATRKTPLDLPPDSRHRYIATIDPATSGNAWTLIIACLSDLNVRRVVLAREWRGSSKRPLVPGQVFREIKELITPYDVRFLYSDQFSAQALREIAAQHSVNLVIEPWTAAIKTEAYETMRTLFEAVPSRIDLPPDPQVTADILGVRQKLGRNGFTYDLATSGGRHSDYAPAIAMAILKAISQPLAPPSNLTIGELAAAQKTSFLNERERARKRSERLGAFRFRR